MVTPFYNCLNYLDTSPPPAKAHPPHLCPKAARALDRDRVTVTTKSDTIRRRAVFCSCARINERRKAAAVVKISRTKRHVAPAAALNARVSVTKT